MIKTIFLLHIFYTYCAVMVFPIHIVNFITGCIAGILQPRKRLQIFTAVYLKGNAPPKRKYLYVCT